MRLESIDILINTHNNEKNIYKDYVNEQEYIKMYCTLYAPPQGVGCTSGLIDQPAAMEYLVNRSANRYSLVKVAWCIYYSVFAPGQ